MPFIDLRIRVEARVGHDAIDEVVDDRGDTVNAGLQPKPVPLQPALDQLRPVGARRRGSLAGLTTRSLFSASI